MSLIVPFVDVVAQVNLVATQLVLERDYPNRLVFDPTHGLDPMLHLSLRGAQVRSRALTLPQSRQRLLYTFPCTAWTPRCTSR